MTNVSSSLRVFSALEDSESSPFRCLSSSVVFVIAYPLDVVPGGGLVTLVTLVDAGIRLPSNALGNHPEVVHIVARGSLMTLHATT